MLYGPLQRLDLAITTWMARYGLGLLFGRGLRAFLLLLYVQMFGSLTPIVR